MWNNEVDRARLVTLLTMVVALMLVCAGYALIELVYDVLGKTNMMAWETRYALDRIRRIATHVESEHEAEAEVVGIGGERVTSERQE